MSGVNILCHKLCSDCTHHPCRTPTALPTHTPPGLAQRAEFMTTPLIIIGPLIIRWQPFTLGPPCMRRTAPDSKLGAAMLLHPPCAVLHGEMLCSGAVGLAACIWPKPIDQHFDALAIAFTSGRMVPFAIPSPKKSWITVEPVLICCPMLSSSGSPRWLTSDATFL